MLQTSEIQDLERLYIFRERERVLRFIEENSFLIPLLLEAHTEIHKYFPDAPLFLRIFNDMESYSEDELLLLIGSKYDPAKTYQKMKQLDDKWWLDAMDQSQTKLSIIVEYQ
jgi:hypothetical protein